MDFNQYTTVINAENKNNRMEDEKIIWFEKKEEEVESSF